MPKKFLELMAQPTVTPQSYALDIFYLSILYIYKADGRKSVDNSDRNDVRVLHTSKATSHSKAGKSNRIEIPPVHVSF